MSSSFEWNDRLVLAFTLPLSDSCQKSNLYQKARSISKNKPVWEKILAGGSGGLTNLKFHVIIIWMKWPFGTAVYVTVIRLLPFTFQSTKPWTLPKTLSWRIAVKYASLLPEHSSTKKSTTNSWVEAWIRPNVAASVIHTTQPQKTDRRLVPPTQ